MRAPLPIRAAFGLLERTAPPIGAAWAERIWFRLPRRRPRRSTGHPGGGRFTITVDGPARTTVTGEVWGDGPVVYLVHGWAGHRGQFAEFVGPMVARGLRVVSFDMPSHGESGPGALGPHSSSFLEFEAALARVVARYGRPHGIVAHSAGAIVTAGALCDGLRAERLVLVAPMASADSYARQFTTALGAGGRINTRMMARIERRVGVPMSHFDVPELGRAVAMPPTLVIHDRDDRSVSVADGAAIAAAWPGARLKVTSDLGHNRILRSPEVVAEVVDFVAP